MSEVSSMAFGGAWSGRKLDVLKNYLHAYTTALSRTPFKVAYIDAFAGAGIREVMSETGDELFDVGLAEDDANYRHGSPLIAMSVEPPFNRFIFIERDADSIEALRTQVLGSFAEKADSVTYRHGDANEVLCELAAKNWNSHRAVAFLDPFALHVSWETIERLAGTKAIDMWLLFPAMAVNRMLARDGDIPEGWERKLTEVFGCDDWRDAFYVRESPDLFGNEGSTKVREVFKTLSAYVTGRLSTVFEAVVDSPLMLCNSGGSPLFLLCFAASNPRGAKIAERIASHIIKKSHGH